MRYAHEQVARVCYAAIRQLAEEQQQPRMPSWNRLRPAERYWWVQSVARARMGMMPEQIQDALRLDLLAEGWRPGEAVDHEQKIHPVLVPWRDMHIKRRIQFQVLQMNAVALTLDVPPVWAEIECVTAPLSDI